MPDQFSPAEQLAAIDLVWQLALDRGMNGTMTAVTVSVLHKAAKTQRERDRVLGERFASMIVGDEDAEFVGWAIGRAAASVGAEIVWPTPDSGEVAERAAGDDTAPGIDTVSQPCPRHPDCILTTPHGPMPCYAPPPPEPTEREKILAEVAAVDLPVPAEAALRGIVNTACEIARGALPGVGRDEIVRAAAMLVLAVERLDGAR